MRIFVSDLHLTDRRETSTVDVDRLFLVLDRSIGWAKTLGFEDIKIVFLGDVFEMLKSNKWLKNQVRPWERPSLDAHVATVDSIFDGILSANHSFFSRLRCLAVEQGVVLEYIPGNHDMVMNTPMGKAARERLLEELPLAGMRGDRFDTIIQDPVHRLLAIHGHEWDHENRYVGDKVAVGDAVVIDILVQLPILVAAELGLRDEFHQDLRFLHHLDSVQPKTPQIMGKWLMKGLGSLDRNTYPSADKQIRQALENLIDHLNGLHSGDFAVFDTAKWWIRFLARMVKSMVGREGALSSPMMLPGLPARHDAYPELSSRHVEAVRRTDPSYRYFLCGHTHRPRLVHSNIKHEGGDNVCTYFNTGTWRHVHQFAGTSQARRFVDFGRSRILHGTFSPRHEECMVIIYSAQEQEAGAPSYYFHRVSQAFEAGPR